MFLILCRKCARKLEESGMGGCLAICSLSHLLSRLGSGCRKKGGYNKCSHIFASFLNKSIFIHWGHRVQKWGWGLPTVRFFIPAWERRTCTKYKWFSTRTNSGWKEVLTPLIHVLVISRLDHCNALYVGLPLTQKLQMVQNAACLLYTSPSPRD